MRGICIWALITAPLMLLVGPAAAHTDFQAATPDDGAVVSGPIDEIVLTFSGQAEPIGTGFEVLPASGHRLSPEAESIDGRTWRLTIDPPVTDGVVGVRWRVQAPDTHPIEGTFSFAVEGEVETDGPSAPDSTTSTVTTTAEGSADRGGADDGSEEDAEVGSTAADDREAVPGGDDASADADGGSPEERQVADEQVEEEAGNAEATGEAGVDQVAEEADAEPDEEVAASAFEDEGGDEDGGEPVGPEAAEDPGAATDDDLASFLEFDRASGPSPEVVGAAGRAAGIGGAVLGLGLLAFAALVLDRTDPERRSFIRWVSVLGAMSAVGWVLDVVARTTAVYGQEASFGWMLETALAGGAYRGFVLHVGGGLLLTVGALVFNRRATVAAPVDEKDLVPANADRPGSETRKLRAGGEPGRAGGEPGRAGGELPIQVSDNTILFTGAAAVMVAFAFDGHTLTVGNRLLIALAAIVHVAASAVWVGGVIGLAAVFLHRRRRALAVAATRLSAQFSVLAAGASAVAAVTGVALTVTILDSLEQLWSTEWGLLLVAKAAAAIAAIAIGGYNHFRLLPAIREREKNSYHADRLRRVAWVEGAVLVGVVVLTAVLVAASTI